MKLDLSASLTIARYQDGHTDPLDVMEGDPFDALFTSVRINPCFPMAVALEVVRRWNAHFKLVNFLQGLHTEAADQMLHEIAGMPTVYPPDQGSAFELTDVAQSWLPAFANAFPGPYHETLHRSHDGVYRVELVGHWSGARPRVEEVSTEEAAHWLWSNGHPLPENLGSVEGEASESPIAS